jgi:hypothetical protein
MAFDDFNAALPQARDQYGIARILPFKRSPVADFHEIRITACLFVSNHNSLWRKTPRMPVDPLVGTAFSP